MPMPPLAPEMSGMTGADTGGGRRPTIVPAPVAMSPELLVRPRRRTFSAKDKLRILADVDAATPSGGIGVILRREGIYSSLLTDWRRQRDAGVYGALSPAKRGPKAAPLNPLAAELAIARAETVRLQRRLDRPKAIIDLQKKVAELLGTPLAAIDDDA